VLGILDFTIVFTPLDIGQQPTPFIPLPCKGGGLYIKEASPLFDSPSVFLFLKERIREGVLPLFITILEGLKGTKSL